MGRIGRVLALVGLVVGVGIAPVQKVAACSCAMVSLDAAVADAEMAIIGTLSGMAEGAPDPPGEPMRATPMVWEVERSRDPLDTALVTISAWPDDGANCGVTFGAGERWLVLAHVVEGRLETNGCMRNVLLAAAAPDEIDLIESMVATPVGASTTADRELSLPIPVLVVAVTVLLVAGVSAVAFRRAGPER